MGSVPVSVVILTRNEAGRIRDCLASAAWAAEVLVIDDGSTDETVHIAESLGARVLRRRMDIEGRHRNWAHDQAAHDWILSLDADERVTPELAQDIAALFRQPPPLDIYDIRRRNHIGSRWIHSHLHLISDGFTPNDSLDIDQRENGARWLDRMIELPWSRRALAYAWALRRALTVIEAGPAPDG